MVQTSKPQRANTFIIEYSPCPGVSRSKIRPVPEEPCTRKRTGRDDSPGFGAPSRLRNIKRGTSPFLAQYSALQMALSAAACAGADMPENKPADAQSGRLENHTTRQNSVGFGHERLLNGPARKHSAVRLIKDILAVCWNCGQSTRPVIVVLLGVVWPAIMAFAAFKTDITGVKPEE